MEVDCVHASRVIVCSNFSQVPLMPDGDPVLVAVETHLHLPAHICLGILKWEETSMPGALLLPELPGRLWVHSAGFNVCWVGFLQFSLPLDHPVFFIIGCIGSGGAQVNASACRGSSSSSSSSSMVVLVILELQCQRKRHVNPQLQLGVATRAAAAAVVIKLNHSGSTLAAAVKLDHIAIIAAVINFMPLNPCGSTLAAVIKLIHLDHSSQPLVEL